MLCQQWKRPKRCRRARRVACSYPCMVQKPSYLWHSPPPEDLSSDRGPKTNPQIVQIMCLPNFASHVEETKLKLETPDPPCSLPTDQTALDTNSVFPLSQTHKPPPILNAMELSHCFTCRRSFGGSLSLRCCVFLLFSSNLCEIRALIFLVSEKYQGNCLK